jgi:hypothetical protein
MSEPNQLYARVHLSRAKLDAFLASAFPDPSEDADVLAWLSKAPYYGDRYTRESIRERISSEATVGEWVERLLEPAPYGFVMPARSSYDEASQAWTLGVLDFSENYDDYLAAVAAFREVAKYKDVPGDDGMLIYACIFANDDVEVALRIKTGWSRFLSDDEAAILVEEANVTMDELKMEGASLGQDDADAS